MQFSYVNICAFWFYLRFPTTNRLQQKDVDLAVQIKSFGGVQTIVVACQSANNFLADNPKSKTNDVVLLITNFSSGGFTKVALL